MWFVLLVSLLCCDQAFGLQSDTIDVPDYEESCLPAFSQSHASIAVIYKENWEWPWLSAFIDRASGNFFCGGSLISKQHILTAAHCFHSKGWTKTKPDDVLVFLGKPDLRIQLEYEIESSVNEIVIHPGWHSAAEAYDADIAIVVLAKTISFTKSVYPVLIPSELNPVNNLGRLVGWGRSEDSDPNNLQDHEQLAKEMPLRSVSNENCFLEFPNLVKISSRRTFCAGWRGFEANACHGDSGSGYLVYGKRGWKVQGIVSSSPVDSSGKCIVNQYAIFTKVSAFSDWIEALINAEKVLPIQFVSVNGNFPSKNVCIMRNLTILPLLLSINNSLPRPRCMSGKHVEINAVGSFTKKFPKVGTTQLSIDESNIQEVPFGLRNIFPDLQVLNITRSSLTIVTKKSIAGLTEINFSQNRLEELDIDTFWDCPELKVLNLNYNRLSYLNENLLIYLSELNEFSADNNFIGYLSRNLFDGNPKLRKISLAGNSLRLIEVEFFNFPKILHIDLSRNPCINASIDAQKEDMLAKLKFQQEIVIKCMQ